MAATVTRLQPRRGFTGATTTSTGICPYSIPWRSGGTSPTNAIAGNLRWKGCMVLRTRHGCRPAPKQAKSL
ncbi:hypothetical protein E2C01_086808 [Portunus trituberculatus]|uniref:Uncharacterized protein n=1 Tax=Portunus trituberculatus TaxID=210409 RepID=A0A5B7J1U1_PORTR|nr:hypothetical protein [Portunus trituberculatus]